MNPGWFGGVLNAQLLSRFFFIMNGSAVTSYYLVHKWHFPSGRDNATSRTQHVRTYVYIVKFLGPGWWKGGRGELDWFCPSVDCAVLTWQGADCDVVACKRKKKQVFTKAQRRRKAIPAGDRRTRIGNRTEFSQKQTQSWGFSPPVLHPSSFHLVTSTRNKQRRRLADFWSLRGRERSRKWKEKRKTGVAGRRRVNSGLEMLTYFRQLFPCDIRRSRVHQRPPREKESL